MSELYQLIESGEPKHSLYVIDCNILTICQLYFQSVANGRIFVSFLIFLQSEKNSSAVFGVFHPCSLKRSLLYAMPNASYGPGIAYKWSLSASARTELSRYLLTNGSLEISTKTLSATERKFVVDVAITKSYTPVETFSERMFLPVLSPAAIV